MYVYTHTYIHILQFVFLYKYVLFTFFFPAETKKGAAFSRKASLLLFSCFYPLQDAIHPSEFLH